MISAVIFDFDGVIAEPGFRLALAELSSNNHEEPAEVVKQGGHALLKSGYVTGQSSEEDFWNLLRSATNISGDRASLREAIIRRSTLRPLMLALVGRLRNQGLPVALLSDHTDWLDEIAASTGLVDHFDYFFNSYHLQRCKQDPQLFDQVLQWMDRPAAQTLFIDDNPANVDRAIGRGLQGVIYRNYSQVFAEITALGADVGGAELNISPG